MGVGEQAAAALRKRWRSFRERGEIPEAVGYGLPTALIVLALFWPFLYGVVPSRDNLCGNQPVKPVDNVASETTSRRWREAPEI